MYAVPSFSERIALGELILTEGSVYELLRRDARIVFDPHIAHSGLIYDELSRQLLADVHRSYVTVAAERGFPILLLADTWRASQERISASRFRGRSVNRDNVEFIREITADLDLDTFVGALTGPRGDGYRPSEAPSSEEARRLHAFQIRELAASNVDVLIAATLPSLEEARGIADLMSESGVPWILSFVVRPDATLLDGNRFADAILEIDDRVAHAPLGYSINCVHPSIARSALRAIPAPARARVIALQANTSARSPEELDGLAELETEPAETYASAIDAILDESSLCLTGGCCGSDVRHIDALAVSLSKRRARC